MEMESCHLKKHLICFNIFYQNGEYIIFWFVIRHFEQYVFSKINAIEGCLLNIRQELETLDDTNDKKIFPSYLILSIEWP